MIGDNKSEKFNELTSNVYNFVKLKIFDIIAVGIVISMLALNLGVLQLREITLNSFLDIVIEAIPFYLTAVLLTSNFYKKGVFVGKTSKSYSQAIKSYSTAVAKLTGHQVDMLSTFCDEYNDNVLVNKRTNLLKSASISYELFSKGDEKTEPLMILSRKELKNKFGKERASIIERAKKLSIKGLKVNGLLGCDDTDDETDFGENEETLFKRSNTNASIKYFVSIIFMTLIGVKDFLEWGWFGIVLVVFKLLYIVCSSYMNYFNGYNDISVKVSNYVNRKSDTLKEFDYWYSNKFNLQKLQQDGNNS